VETTSEVQRRLTTAREAARAAGDVLRAQLHQLAAGTLTVETKAENPLDLVSEVDRLAQAAAVKVITREHAPCWIVGEEAVVEVRADGTIVEMLAPGHDAQWNWTRPAQTRYWLIDGLDGTSNYLRGLRPFCAAVAYVEEGQAIAGAVYDPIADELFSAGRGQPGVMNSRPIRVTSATALEGAVVATETFRSFWSAGIDNWPRQLGLRTFGSPIVSMAWVAAGRLDAYLYVDVGRRQRLGPWDVAVGALLVEQAGGIVSGPDGRPLDIWGRGAVVSCSPELHAEIVARLPSS
jgi:myo-inositol-1(or 4)-monophosphatase